jgi:polysaccharide deacetylase family protein (PEP-CTERM system associated)
MSNPRLILNAMTVDVEDYFQVSAFEAVVSRDRWGEYERRVGANTDRLLAIFADSGVHATFFVLGWVAERDPALVRRVAAAGHEIASHGYGHRLVYQQTSGEFREDLKRAKGLLEALIDRPVRGYRAPSFSITESSLWALDVLIEEGFAWDASIFPIRHDRYGVPSAPRHPFWIAYGRGGHRESSSLGSDPPGGPAGAGQAPLGGLPVAGSAAGTRVGSALLEIPGSTVRIAGLNLPTSGGGYFRLLPYRWTEWSIGRVNRVEARPVVFYLHPWEIDPGQPRQRASAISRFRHYRNLDRTESRLRRLLRRFSFGTVTEAMVPASGAPEARA